MSCPCTANSLRLFIRSFSTLELESSRSALRNPINRSFQSLQPRRFASGDASAAPAIENAYASSVPENSIQPKNAIPARTFALKRGAIMDVADLTDDSIEELLKETSRFAVRQEPEPEKKLGSRKTKDFQRARATESWPAELLQASHEGLAQQSRTRRPGEITSEDRKESKLHNNPEWSSLRDQSQSRSRAGKHNFSAVKVTPSYPANDHATPDNTSSDYEDDYVPRGREQWQIQKAALKEKLGGEAWNPRKRLSPDAIEGIRALHAQFPDQYHTESLAAQFEVSPEAIRRILKSKWKPNEEEEQDRKERWFKRGERVWERYAELGMKPPKQWRILGVDRRDGAVPLWDRKRRNANAGNTKGGGIIIKKGLKAGDVRNEWDSTVGSEDWV